MNKLTADKRRAVVAALVEGNSVRATCRMTGVAKGTALKLVADLGRVCQEYQDTTLCGLKCRRVQCDEIWSYIGMKQKTAVRKGRTDAGDIWTWTAIDADSKLAVAWKVGNRGSATAYDFMQTIADRLANRIQLTTDGHKVYIEAVEAAFGSEIDYAMLIKLYGAERPAIAQPSASGRLRNAARAAPTRSTSARPTSNARTSRCA